MENDCLNQTDLDNLFDSKLLFQFLETIVVWAANSSY